MQEIVKAYFNRGERPPLYYMRTGSGLEVDLLIERSLTELIPVEVKLNKTPSLAMAAPIARLRSIFSALPFVRGHVVPLSDTALPLATDVSVTPLRELLSKL